MEGYGNFEIVSEASKRSVFCTILLWLLTLAYSALLSEKQCIFGVRIFAHRRAWSCDPHLKTLSRATWTQ